MLRTMRPAPPQKELFACPPPTPGTVFVNDRVCIQTEEKTASGLRPWVVFATTLEDRPAEAYAWFSFLNQDMQIRTISHAASAIRPDRSSLQGHLKGWWLSALARREGGLQAELAGTRKTP